MMKRKIVDRKSRVFQAKAFKCHVTKVRRFTFGTSWHLFFVLVSYFKSIKSGPAQGLIHLKGMKMKKQFSIFVKFEFLSFPLSVITQRLSIAFSCILAFQVKLLFVSFCRYSQLRKSKLSTGIHFLSFIFSVEKLKHLFLFQNHPT